MLAIRFVVGRVTKHLLRAPTVEGWLGEEGDAPQRRVSLALKKLPGGKLGLEGPGADVLAITPEGAAAIQGEDRTVLLGWPETIFVVRRGGVVVYGEGDVVHFGDLALDAQRTLRRVGYAYLNESAADVRAHMQLEERSAIDPQRALKRLGFDAGAERLDAAPAPAAVPAGTPAVDTIRLAPGQRARFGPYELINERSYDHERRPMAGEHGHAYFFHLRRLGEEPVGARPADLPDVHDVTTPDALIACARRLRLLDDDEALGGEPLLAERLQLLEGPRGAIEQALAAEVPGGPRLEWHGDVLRVTAPRLARGEGGAPIVGRAIVALAPAGLPTVTRSPTQILPGRLRRATTKPG